MEWRDVTIYDKTYNPNGVPTDLECHPAPGVIFVLHRHFSFDGWWWFSCERDGVSVCHERLCPIDTDVEDAKEMATEKGDKYVGY